MANPAQQTKWPDTIKPSKVVSTPHGAVGVAPVTLPEHRSEFWYVAIFNTGSWKTKSVVKVVARNGQNLENEVKMWASRGLT